SMVPRKPARPLAATRGAEASRVPQVPPANMRLETRPYSEAGNQRARMARQGTVAATPRPVRKRAAVTPAKVSLRLNHTVESPTSRVNRLRVFRPPHASDSRPEGS